MRRRAALLSLALPVLLLGLLSSHQAQEISHQDEVLTRRTQELPPDSGQQADFPRKVPRLRPEGQERADCRSQKEQYDFWKTFDLKPSEALMRAMREYEQFHADCRAQEGNLAEKIANKEPLPCNYGIWIATWDGIGNRVLSLAASLVYCMLTKRVLLVDRRWDIDKFLCEPFPKSSWMIPDDLDTESMQREYDRIGDFTAYASAARAQGEVITTPYNILADINHATEADMTFFCQTEMPDIEKIPLMIIRSNMYFIVGHYYTYHRARLEEWFPDRRVFPHIARYLLSPVDSLWGKIVGYWNEHLASASHRLGVQMRMYEHPWRLEKSLRLLQCSQQYNYLPVLANASAEGASPAADRESKETTTCLVASLHKEFFQHLVDTFGGAPMVDSHRVTVLRPTNTRVQESGNHDHNEEVMMEIWLLSFSDFLIASPGSTFGYAASGLRGLPHLFLNGLFHNSDEDFPHAPCSMATGEPCWQRPPWKVKCYSDPDFEDPWHMAPGVVEQCSDYPRGTRIHVPSGGEQR